MKKFIIPLIIFLLAACKKEASQTYLPSAIKGVATPIYLPLGGGEILLSDYFLKVEEIDSISVNKGYTATLSSDKNKLIIVPTDSLGAIANVRVWTAGAPNDIPIYKSSEEEVTFTFSDPDKKRQSVMVKGVFNGWVPERSVMQFNKGNWSYTAKFNPGKHPYLLVVDGKEQLDPLNKTKQPNGLGGYNSIVSVGKSAKKPQLRASSNKGNSFTLVSTQPLSEVFIYINNQLVKDAYLVKRNNGTVEVKIPPLNNNGRSLLRAYAYNQNGRANDLLLPLEGNTIVNSASQLNRGDFHTQVMYFLMVDRFNDGDTTNTKRVENDTVLPIANHFGGDLKGVLDKIEEGYFEQLGINTIWLSPITQNPEGAYGLWKNPYTKFSGYHGYWPISNTKIDTRFGDEKLFKELIEKAHAKNMNIVLDYVANHVHEEHPLYKENPDWATNLYLPDGTLNTERWDEHRLTTWFDTFLPTLDFSKPEVVEKMTDSAAFWVTNYELDGFRHDATKHIQEEFWRTLTKKVKSRTGRPIFQIGETYGSYELIRSYINTGMLDAQFDFNQYDAAVNAFARKEASFKPLANTLLQGLEYFGSNHLMGNITGNQDRARFISYASGDVKFDEDAKVAGWTRDIEISDSTAYKNLEMLHAFNLVIPGIPCIYYGDEYGSPGGNDPDNRRQMKFENLGNKELSLREKVSQLVKMRRNSMALLYGTTEIVQADGTVLIIKRAYFDEEVIAIFNKSASPKKFNVFGKQLVVNPFDYHIETHQQK